MNFGKLTPVIVSTVKEQVYRKVQEAIISGSLPPGREVTISQLARDLGVSLMPVREAIRALEVEKLISVQKSRRIKINELSTRDLHEILMIRINLECMAVERGIERCTDETVSDLERILEGMKTAKDSYEFLTKNKQFHHTLYLNADMPILREIIDYLWQRVSPYLSIYVSKIPESKTYAIHYHEGMIQGAKERDGEKVCKWLRLDLKKGAEFVTTFLRSQGSAESD